VSYSRPQIHRKDGNQDVLVELFEKMGGLWVPYSNKPFDGWAYHERFGGGYLPVEIKLKSREGHADEYTERQKKLMKKLKDRNAPWLIWRNDDDVLACLGLRYGLPGDFEIIPAGRK
jgi:hypothetical protein